MADFDHTRDIKVCAKCRRSLPRTEFYKHASQADGLQAYCKDCKRAYSGTPAALERARAKYHEKMATNPDRRRQQSREYKRANRKKVHAWARARYLRIKERQAAYVKASRAEDPEKFRNRLRSYRAKNASIIKSKQKAYKVASRDRIAASARAYRETNKDVLARKNREYRERNIEKELARSRRFRQANPHIAVDNARNRRARQRGLFVECIKLDVVFARDGRKCGICRKRVARRDASLDHIVPISKGGQHSYQNVQLAHLSCNKRKNVRTIGQLRLIG